MNDESFPVSISVRTRLRTETGPQHDSIEAVLNITSGTLKLHALGLNDFEMLLICTDLPPHGMVAAAFGCIYVLEGATLGGRFISQMFRKSLGVRPETGGRHDCTGAMWQAFPAAFTASVVKPCDEEEVVRAAKDTFPKSQHWMNREGDN